jgi:hypothetical protein
MDRSTDPARPATPRPSSSVPTGRVVPLVARVVGDIALVLGAIIALSLTAPTINAAEGGVGADGRLVVVVGGGRDGPVHARQEGAWAERMRTLSAAVPADRGPGPSVTPPPTDVSVGPGPAFPLLPGWGWVVLGLICFCVVLGLVWPEDRDRR